jgi:hypothetical protein
MLAKRPRQNPGRRRRQGRHLRRRRPRPQRPVRRRLPREVPPLRRTDHRRCREPWGASRDDQAAAAPYNLVVQLPRQRPHLAEALVRTCRGPRQLAWRKARSGAGTAAVRSVRKLVTTRTNRFGSSRSSRWPAPSTYSRRASGISSGQQLGVGRAAAPGRGRHRRGHRAVVREAGRNHVGPAEPAPADPVPPAAEPANRRPHGQFSKASGA